jgi:predicted DNA-binding helix-hairpin-helix protein
MPAATTALYCATRCSRDIPRASFRPEELADLTAELTRAELISGLFLSSGIVGDADSTMARMIETVEILRHKHDLPRTTCTSSCCRAAPRPP